jgi:hypothetical protein
MILDEESSKKLIVFGSYDMVESKPELSTSG